MFFESLALGVASGLFQGIAGGLFGGGDEKEFKYTPYGPWINLQKDVISGIKEGLKEGGYTFSDATVEKLRRQALEDIARLYPAQEQHIKEQLIPYGNIGAAGRGLVGLGVAEATQKATALRNIDITRETEKLKSYSNLLAMGGSLQDPMLPAGRMNLMSALNQGPTPLQAMGSGMSTGLTTYLNLNQAEEDTQFWNQYLNQTQPAVSSTNLLTQTPGIGFTW